MLARLPALLASVTPEEKMVFSALVQAANKLAATILPSNATPIPPVQQAFTLADTEGSRARLQGAIARAPGLLGAHVYYLIPDALSPLTARSKSLSLSDDGDATSATDRSEAAFLDILRHCGRRLRHRPRVGKTR